MNKKAKKDDLYSGLENALKMTKNYLNGAMEPGVIIEYINENVVPHMDDLFKNASDYDLDLKPKDEQDTKYADKDSGTDSNKKIGNYNVGSIPEDIANSQEGQDTDLEATQFQYVRDQILTILDDSVPMNKRGYHAKEAKEGLKKLKKLYQ